MYFNDKNNTNIDNEFEKESILSKLLNLINKYKIIIIIAILLIIGIIVIFSFRTSLIKTIYYLDLKGDEEITLYTGSDYIEPGYNAYTSKEEKIDSKVEINSNVDMDVPGEYTITYTIGDVTKTRKVTVIEKPAEYTYIYLKTVNNNVNVYLKVGEKYIEPGYMVFSSTGKNLTNEVTVIGNVDTSKKGSYKLVYSLVDQNGVTVSATRTVIVMDSEISLSLSTEEYTNEDVTINVQVMDNYFDYMILPDKEKVSTTTASYKVSENGTYKFVVYNKKGDSKEASIKVSNINRTVPSGSCSGSFEDGVSTININASDDIGIKKYVINNKEYISSKITINSEFITASITIYDKAGNTKNISCNLEDKNVVILFDDNITLSYQYFNDDGSMKYALYTPSFDSKNKKIPLIVWLHGSGEFNSSESVFKNSGLLRVLNGWSLEGFNAYVLCPHSKSSWNSESSKNKLDTLVNKIVLEKNIDTNKIIIVGHSAGALGAQYMAYHRRNFYSALVVLSGYNTGLNLNEIKNMPIKAYVGTAASGEDSASYNYTVGTFTNIFGSDKVTVYSTSHGNVPKKAFTEDKNGDGRSDLIEWMLTQSLNK